MASKLGIEKIAQLVFDEATNSYKVTLVDAAIEISAADSDSIIAVQGIEPRQEYNQIVYNYGTPNTVIKIYKNGATVVGTVTEVYDESVPPKLTSVTRT